MSDGEVNAEKYLWRIRRRMLENNQNWLAVICGQTGSGKSYAAISLADSLSPRGITIQRNVVFTAKQLLEKITHKEDLRQGDVIVFDEAGVGMAAREWHSVQNRLLGSILQTFRHLNVAVIFTVPDFSFIDVQARKLLHAYFDTGHIDREKEVAYLRVLDLQHNSRYDKTYFKMPLFVDEHGRRTKMKFLGVPRPRKELEEEYEAVKVAYTADLNQRALDELSGKNRKPTPIDLANKEASCIEELRKDYHKYIRKAGKKQYLDHGAIQRDYGLAHHAAMRAKRKVEDEVGIGYNT